MSDKILAWAAITFLGGLQKALRLFIREAIVKTIDVLEDSLEKKTATFTARNGGNGKQYR